MLVDVGAVAMTKVVEGVTLRQEHAADNDEGAYVTPRVAHAGAPVATARLPLEPALGGRAVVKTPTRVVVVVVLWVTRTVEVAVDVWTSVASVVDTAVVSLLHASSARIHFVALVLYARRNSLTREGWSLQWSQLRPG